MNGRERTVKRALLSLKKDPFRFSYWSRHLMQAYAGAFFSKEVFRSTNIRTIRTYPFTLARCMIRLITYLTKDNLKFTHLKISKPGYHLFLAFLASDTPDKTKRQISANLVAGIPNHSTNHTRPLQRKNPIVKVE